MDKEVTRTSEKNSSYQHEEAWAAILDEVDLVPDAAKVALGAALPEKAEEFSESVIPEAPSFPMEEEPLAPLSSQPIEEVEVPEVPSFELPHLDFTLNEQSLSVESDGVLEMTITPRQLDNPLFAPTDGAGEYEMEDQAFLEELKKIPNKMAFKIGEAADIIGVKQYVLRYWETEFDVLKPKKSAHNQRMFSRRDVETGLLIKKLLYKDRFSIEGARKALKTLRKKVKEEKQKESALSFVDDAIEQLQEIREDLATLKRLFA